MKKRTINASMCYTLLFIPCFLLSRSVFVVLGKLPMWNVDGLLQHYPYFQYIGRLLRDWIETGHFSAFSFELGLGQDVLSSVNYYGLGEPLMLLSAFVTGEVGFCLVLALRTYLAGLMAVLLGKRLRLTTAASVCAGLIYILSPGYAANVETSQYSFACFYILFPMTLLGIESVFSNERPWVLAAAVLWGALCGYYFLFSDLLLALVYALVRQFTRGEVQPWRTLPTVFLRCVGWIVAGACMAGVVLLPSVAGVLGSQRMDTIRGMTGLRLLWSVSELRELPQAVLTGRPMGAVQFIPALGIAALLCVLLRGSRSARALLLVTCAAVLIPATGTVLNGMAYETQRWGYAVTLLIALLTAAYLPTVLEPSAREKETGRLSTRAEDILLLTGIAFAVAYELFVTRRSDAVRATITIFMLLLSWGVIGLRRRPALCRRLAAGLLIADMIMVYGLQVWGLADRLVDAGTAQTRATGIYERLPESDTGRTDVSWSALGETMNGAAVAGGIRGASIYNSTMSAGMQRLLIELGIVSHMNSIQGLDADPILEALMGVECYAGDSGETHIPYGFVGGDGGVYRNTMALPIAYAQGSVLSREEFDELSPVEKRWALLQCAVTDETTGAVAHATPERTAVEVPLRDVTIGFAVDEKGWNVTPEGSAILTFEAPTGCELYLEISGACSSKWDYSVDHSICVECGGVEVERLLIDNGRMRAPASDTVILDLGYSDAARTEAVVTFTFTGSVNFGSMRLWAQPMDRFEEYISALSENGLKDVEITSDRVSGTITVQDQAVVVSSIPYSSGWSCSVDGVPTRVFASAGAFTAVEVTAGTHSLVWTYETPYLRAGLCMSIAGLGTFIIALLCRHCGRKR